MPRLAPRRLVVILLASSVLLPAGSAFADEPVETAIRGWVSAIDASPQWVAGFGELSYDATTRTATIRNLSIRTENPSMVPGGKLEVTFDRIDVSGYAEQAGGAFSFDDMKVAGARILADAVPAAVKPADRAPAVTPPEPSPQDGATAGDAAAPGDNAASGDDAMPGDSANPGDDAAADAAPPAETAPVEPAAAPPAMPVHFDANIASIDIKGATVPSFASFVFDPAKPATSWVRLVSLAAKASAETIDMEGMTYDTEVDAERSHSTIEYYRIASMKDGRIDKGLMGAMTQETPSPDGLVKMHVGSGEVRGYDLGAILRVLDPDSYAGGVGDGVWHDALALEAIRDWRIELPGAELRIGAFEVENFKVRQPERPFFTEMVDKLLTSPELSNDEADAMIRDHLPGFFSFMGVGAFRVSDLDVVAPEIERFHLGDFHINDLSSDGLGEIGIGNLDLAIPGKGSAGAERIAVGGFRFPAMSTIMASLEAEKTGAPVDPLPLIPTMAFAEAVNLDLVQDGKKLGALDRARLDLSDYIGPVPTTVAFDMRGLDLDQSLVADPQAKRLLKQLGYDRLQAEYGFKIHWRPADESLNLEDFKLAIKDVGSISADIALAGLKRSMIENPLTAESVLPDLVFTRGKVVVQDGSVVDRAIGMEAKKKNQTPEKYREDIAGALPLTLMLVLKNPTFQQKLAPALQAFIRTPGTLTLTAAPATPVPLTAILAAAESDPRSLPNLISLEVKSEPKTP